MSRFILLLILRTALCSKSHVGQRTFADSHIIDFIDPAKHGFHIILDSDVVSSHLQPVHLPTVYVSAISLKPSRPQTRRHFADAISNKSISNLRITKILYPENGNPDDGLLDGRTIKILGLQERTWYYVCVEFESNVNRHELVTGTSCRAARTLDKFGKTVESTISEIELIEITDNSLRIRMTVDADFPLRISAYLENGISDNADTLSAVPAQTFIAKRAQILNVFFGPVLRADTSYGKFCVVEEPLLETYTAMGRLARAAFERCYFDDLRTKPHSTESFRKFYETGTFFVGEQTLSNRVDGQKQMAQLVGSLASTSWGNAKISVLLFISLSLFVIGI